MPATTDPSDNPGGRPQKTRLESEIEEILERAERKHPLPPPTPIRIEPERSVGAGQERVQASLRSLRRWLTAMPLLVAYMCAVVAHMFSDLSPFLTRLAVDIAVIAVFWPIFEGFRAQQTSASSSTMWRGRDMAPASHDAPSPWQQVRQWLRNRRLLP